MRRIFLSVLIGGIALVGVASAAAEEPSVRLAPAPAVVSPVEQSTITPVQWRYYGNRGYYYSRPYRSYYYPYGYYEAPVYPHGPYVYPGWRTYRYGYPGGFYYNGPRRSFGIEW